MEVVSDRMQGVDCPLCEEGAKHEHTAPQADKQPWLEVIITRKRWFGRTLSESRFYPACGGATYGDRQMKGVVGIKFTRLKDDVFAGLLKIFRDRIAALKAQAEEDDALRLTLSKILTDTANELHGGPLENGLWSWHDLAELAKAMRERAERAEAELTAARRTGEYWKAEHNAANAELTALREGDSIAFASLKKIVDDAYEAWDSDNDVRVGKILRALAGFLPGYRQDVDRLHERILDAEKVAG
jgi:hypothetical protein